MTVGKSTKRRPSKPDPSFPLYAASNGQWCRKIRGKHYSFGKWDDPIAALKKHNEEYSFLKYGIEPPNTNDNWTVGDLVNEYLSVQEERVEIGDLEKVTFEGYKRAGELIVEYIPKQHAVEAIRPDDFRKLRNGLVGRFTPAVARVQMTRVRSIFKFAYEEQLIKNPVVYGQGFKSPKIARVRKARAEKPKKLFRPDQIHLLIENASPAVRAMILLATNVGMNNADLGNLKPHHIDFTTGWLDYPRHKTGIERTAPLWTETLEAVMEYMLVRQQPLVQFESYLFITQSRRKWAHSSLPSEFRKLKDLTNSEYDENGNIKTDSGGLSILLDPLPIPHGTFGYFRHTFETIAGGSRDQVAVDAIMGHVDNSMAAQYREEIDEGRLEAVVDHVRQWLFNGGSKK